MKRLSGSVCSLFVLCALAGGCTSGSNPIHREEAPHVSRPYDYARKGVQITRVYHDEEANGEIEGMYNEWVVVQSDTDVITRGWDMDIGRGVRHYAFPDTMHRTLVIYTRERTVPPTDKEYSLNLSQWIWEEHDTVRIYNGGRLMAVFQY